MNRQILILEDDSEQWLREILTEHGDEARQRAHALLEAGIQRPSGCIETDTGTPRRVKFRGRQVAAYRFVYCVLNGEVASRDHVVRHRCHNRLCINPGHNVAQRDTQEVSTVIMHGFEMQDPTPDISLVEAPLDISQAKAIRDCADGVLSDPEVRLELAASEPSRFCLLNWGVDRMHGISPPRGRWFQIEHAQNERIRSHDGRSAQAPSGKSVG